MPSAALGCFRSGETRTSTRASTSQASARRHRSRPDGVVRGKQLSWNGGRAMNVRVAARFTPALLILFPAVVPLSVAAVQRRPSHFKPKPICAGAGGGARFQRNAVGNLRKEDFQLFDKGKPQSSRRSPSKKPPGKWRRTAACRMRTRRLPIAAPRTRRQRRRRCHPEHYVALLFDDLHFKIGNPGPPPGYIGDAADMCTRAMPRERC